MFDPKTIFDAGAATANLLTAVLKTTEAMRKAGANPSIAAAIAQTPAAAFSLSEQFEQAVTALRQRMTAADIDFKTPVNKLNINPSWFAEKKDRAMREFKPKVEGIRAQLETLMDDMIAVARCQNADKLIADSYDQALERKRSLAKELDYDRPVGEIIEVLNRYAQELHAEAGDVQRGRRV